MDDSLVMDANARLAALKGWTNMVDVGGALMGRPPDGGERGRGQAMVPDWCGDWSAAGPLIGEHGLMVEAMGAGGCAGGVYVRFDAFADRDTALRFAIVAAATHRLARRVAKAGGVS
ncbi:hypothetical protein [Janthinobacterium fluminis]|uniref:Uncharacterized protein n=1 Tax=Janthinobacterium fluminis TaxID=2987524 RepID=A0ABT5JUS8_9BURK|nr:hypothetical protein [Janthinobacterium fluminis]MDC8756246.1 hypothetical protein [Janthinobacterium fluminis]